MKVFAKSSPTVDRRMVKLARATDPSQPIIRVVYPISDTDCRECAHWKPGKLSGAKLLKNLTWSAKQSHWVGRLHREGGRCKLKRITPCVTCGCSDIAPMSAHEKAERMRRCGI